MVVAIGTVVKVAASGMLSVLSCTIVRVLGMVVAVYLIV